MTPEQFFNTDYIKGLIAKYKRTATLLRPHKSEIIIGKDESKFGGIPNFDGFENYPCCDKCKTPLNFVLQLYKKDFPTFYYPDGTNLFQLFRCPYNNCPDAYSEQSDHKMFHYYFTITSASSKQLIKPTYNLVDSEAEVSVCFLKPKVVDDFPNYDDFEGNDFVNIETKFGDQLEELFMNNHSAIQNTKFGGYPSYTQPPVYPKCSCGKTKDFFFQLSSEDIPSQRSLPLRGLRVR
jgi:uncharacterized protein YwqG